MNQYKNLNKMTMSNQESDYTPYSRPLTQVGPIENAVPAHPMDSPIPSHSVTHINDHGHYPSQEEFEEIVQDYLKNLSSKKRDKALIDQDRYKMVLKVLKDPRNTSLSTAQFRFWVKKMFQLGSKHVVCHDGKPVATREEIYSILVRAHREVHHGGRDKTSTLVRQRYSWIPKELIARFVRHCPFCISRRNGNQQSSYFASPIYPELSRDQEESVAMVASNSCESELSYGYANSQQGLKEHEFMSWNYYSGMDPYQNSPIAPKPSKIEFSNKISLYAPPGEHTLPYMTYGSQTRSLSPVPVQFPVPYYLHEELKPAYPFINDFFAAPINNNPVMEKRASWCKSAPSPSMSLSSVSSSSTSSPMALKYSENFFFQEPASSAFNLLCHQTFY